VSYAGRVSRPPLASVIVINYNYARFLPAAIESALAQTYPDTEVVVVDDGSTDDSWQVIAGYGDRVRPVLKENGGHTSAFNAGFAASHGQLICFLDADDLLLPTALEEAAARLLGDPRVVKVHWPLWVIDERGRPTGELEPSRPLEGGDLRDLAIRDGPAIYKSAPTSGNAFSRTFLKQVFPLPAAGHRDAADGYLKALAPIFGIIETLAEPQSCYRVHRTNFFHSRTLAQKARVLVDRFECRARALSRHLREQGVEVDWQVWTERNGFYRWMSDLAAARADLIALLPPGSRFLLVDQARWGNEQLVEDRTALPYGTQDGSYSGPPEDDRAAVREVKRIRRQGASWIVFWRDAFWWLEQYPGLAHYLDAAARPTLSNDRLIVFEFRQTCVQPEPSGIAAAHHPARGD
jgi:glycosyltransferase involved in cell wall biosynthesis